MEFFQPLTRGEGPGVMGVTTKARRAELQTTASRERLLLESMANATARLLAGGHSRASINSALAGLGSALGAARVYIFESHKEWEHLIEAKIKYSVKTPIRS